MVTYVRANESKYFSDLSNIIYIFETICGESDPAKLDLTNYSTLHLNQEFIDEEYKKEIVTEIVYISQFLRRILKYAIETIVYKYCNCNLLKKYIL